MTKPELGGLSIQSAVDDDQMSLSVVICTCSPERTTQLWRLLRSLEGQTRRPTEVVVVVDSNPDLLAEVQGLAPRATVAANRHQRGLSGARNTGVELSSGSIVAFVDDDAVPSPDWVERLGAAYRDPTVIGAGGSVEADWEAGTARWFPPEFGWVVGCDYRGLPIRREMVRNLIGCNMSFRRSVFGTVGGFAADLGRIGTIPAGCEETEFCIRLKRRFPGQGLLFDPEIVVRHMVTRQRSSWAYFRARCFAEGRSKAAMSRLTGARRGLAAEKAYVARALPAGIRSAVLSWARGQDRNGLVRAGAMGAGLLITVAGFVAGTIEGYVLDPLRILSGGAVVASPRPEDPVAVVGPEEVPV